MGTSLTGLTPATTYDALIKVGDNGPIDATLKVLSDGLGNNLPMEASSTTINFTNGLQQSGVAVPTASQVNAKQDTLVSGTNIKTINGTSVLGAGNIVTPTTSPSGVSGAIQFSNGSAFASDASNFFWDNVNKRLGVGTNAPSATAHLKGSGSTSATTAFLVQNVTGTEIFKVRDDGTAVVGTNTLTVLGTTISNSISVGGNVSLQSGANSLSWVGSSRIRALSDSTILLNDSTATTFDRLQFGGTTSAFPCIKRVTNNLEIRNADDTFGAGLSIGASLNVSAVLQADSTTKGFLPPRMTTTQKNAISSPASGLVVYDSTTNKLCCYNGSTWNDLF